MSAEALVASLEQDGVRLKIDGDKLKLEAPADRVPGQETLAGLREHKTAVLEYLRTRMLHEGIQFSSFPIPIGQKTEKREDWPSESLDAERRFGQPHAKLFPFIGRKVRTPAGAGTLIQVFAERVTVVLDSDLDKCAMFSPRDIEPASREL